MGKLLSGIIGFAFAGGIKKLLLGAGLGLISIAIVYTVINYYIAKIISQLNELGALGKVGSIGLSLLGIAGVDTAISIVIGAYIVKFTIKKSQVFLGKKG